MRTSVLMFAMFCGVLASAQTKPAPDTLTFINGEQLTGELEKANADGITFKSTMAGEITVKWANIKNVSSSKSFAIITNKEKLTHRNALAVVPQGTVTADTKDITVGTKPPTPIANTNLVIPSADFDKAVNHEPNLFHGWSGVANAGASLVRSTQDSTNFNGAITLIRTTPTVDWLPPRDNTILNYNQAYGTTSQTGIPTVKTNIFHANAERDEYFHPRLFVFGSATFDHNFSQSLDLQQAYGGGIGVSVYHSARTQFDFKGDLHYEKQTFFPPTASLDLVGSTFSETLLRKLPKGLVLNEFGSYSASWNVTSAYSAHVNASLTFPVYKGFGFNIGAVDDYLNSAPVGSNKNSTQFTTGLTYTIKPR